MSRESVIKHKGVIRSVDPLVAEIISESACAACHAKGYCSMSEQKRKEITITTPPTDWTPVVGQEVEVVMRTALGVKAVWLAMGIPFLLLAAAVLGCVLLHTQEWVMGVSVLGVLTVYYFSLYLLKDRIAYDFYITLHHTNS